MKRKLYTRERKVGGLQHRFPHGKIDNQRAGQLLRRLQMASPREDW